MSKPEVFLTGFLYFLWIWRIASFLYSSYFFSESVTPSCAGPGVKIFVMCMMMCASLSLYLIPMSEYPRLSLTSRLVSVPSQISSMVFVYRNITNAIDSRRVKALVIIVCALSLIETIYMINYDWNRIE